MARFSDHMISGSVQAFWAALQRVLITDAAAVPASIIASVD